MTNNN